MTDPFVEILPTGWRGQRPPNPLGGTRMSGPAIDKLYKTCTGGPPVTDSQNIQPMNQSELRHF